VRETTADLERLQTLLDRSYEHSGRHLASIHTPDRRLGAAALAERLQGVRILAVATTTADGRPLARPVDGIFYRGEFWFGSADDSLLMRHLRVRPAVSAVHTVGESLGITIHGDAVLEDLDDPANAGFRDICREIYGIDWGDWGAPYARIKATRMFTFLLEKEPG